MVGGFSRSELLVKHIEDNFSKYVGGKERILRPLNPEQAVMAGAVYYGLNPTIFRSRKSRLTYGVNSRMPFDEGIDPQSKKVFNPHRNLYYCEDRFSIFVNAFQDVDCDSVITNSYSPIEPDQKEVSFTIYSTTKKNPRYIDEEGVIKIGEFDISMPDISGGVNRAIKVEMCFGESEIKVKAIDLTSKNEKSIPVHFTSTFIPEDLSV